MKISEMIAALEEIREEHGDLNVERYGLFGRQSLRNPSVVSFLNEKNSKEEKACRVD